MADGLGFRVEKVEAGSSDWPQIDPTIATADPLPPPDFPGHVFPARWLSWLMRAAGEAGAPVDYVAGALLAVVGAVIGNSRWGSPWGRWRHPPVVNIAAVGTPSAGKSPAISTVIDALGDLMISENADWQERLRDHHTASATAQEVEARWQAEVKLAVGMGTPSPAQPIAATSPPPPRKRRIASTDPTMEAARDLSAANPRGLLLHRDELAGWVAGMGRYGAGGGSGAAERGFWLSAHEGSRWSSDRVKDGDDGADIPHLTWGILGGVQPDRLASVLLSGDDDGMAGRFLYIWPRPPSGKPQRPQGDELPFDLAPLLLRLRELDMPDGQPVVLRFDDDAAEAFNEWRGEVRDMETQASGMFLGWVGKLPGMAVRLSVIFAHLEWLVAPEGKPAPGSITAKNVARSMLFLSDYAVPMARRAFGEAALPEAERDARRLARWLVAQSVRVKSINARELRRMASGPGISTAPRIEAALGELHQLGWVRPAQTASDRIGRGGRPKGDWEVHPGLWSAPS